MSRRQIRTGARLRGFRGVRVSQSAIENFNDRWQPKLWARFHHDSLADLTDHSRRYVAASRHRAGPRIDAAPPRRRFPENWVMDLYAPTHGSAVYLRRTNEGGVVSLMGHSFPLPSSWTHHLVRCEVDLDLERIRFFALDGDPHLTSP